MASNKVVLNVGGERFTTTVDTLTAREKDTFFTALFARQWQAERDPKDESIFIDRNGKVFSHILEYLRTGTVPGSVKNDQSLRENLMNEADYFRLPKLQTLLTFPGSTLLESSEHKKKLNEFYGKPWQQWELIYKASRNGFGAKVFHSKCDAKGPTMTVIQSTNKFLFGGYTSAPWSTATTNKSDAQAFLFTLTNPNNIPPTKYQINPGNVNSAVYHHSVFGPTFGDSYDLHVVDNSNSTNTIPTSFTKFPTSYIDSTGKGDKTFTGAKSFIASDIEVFKLV